MHAGQCSFTKGSKKRYFGSFARHLSGQICLEPFKRAISGQFCSFSIIARHQKFDSCKEIIHQFGPVDL